LIALVHTVSRTSKWLQLTIIADAVAIRHMLTVNFSSKKLKMLPFYLEKSFSLYNQLGSFRL